MPSRKTSSAALKEALGQLGQELSRIESERERLLQEREAIETAPRPIEAVQADLDAAQVAIAERWWKDKGRRTLATLLGPNRAMPDAKAAITSLLRQPGALVDAEGMATLFWPIARDALIPQLEAVAAERGDEPMTAEQRQRKLDEIDRKLAALDDELAALQAEVAESGLAMAMEPIELPPLPDAPELTREPPEPPQRRAPRHYGPDGQGTMVRRTDGETIMPPAPQPTQAESITKSESP